MITTTRSPLGQPTAFAGHYDPALLFPIDRAPNRAALGIDGALPFHGVDIWNAYELSWLDLRGKPHVAIAELRVPATSPRLIESKSLKLYLNGFAAERLTTEDLGARLRRDLGASTGAEVGVRFVSADAFMRQQLATPEGEVIDELDIPIDHYGPPRAEFLQVATGTAPISETLVSRLLKSNCPVTGQPDWGSVQIRYTGAPIDHAGLLRYLVSFREHAAFHEDCVERMFVDITRQCAPRKLTVYARYTRRGGIDINPLRSSTVDAEAPNPRWTRQ